MSQWSLCINAVDSFAVLQDLIVHAMICRRMVLMLLRGSRGVDVAFGKVCDKWSICKGGKSDQTSIDCQKVVILLFACPSASTHS